MSVTTRPDPVAEALRRALIGRRDVQLALLFGSQATGRSRPDSDVDVAVLAPSADWYGLMNDLTDALGRDVHLVDLQRAGVPVLDEILRHGVVVHEAAPGRAAAWRSRTLLQLETDRPAWERTRDAWLRRVAETGS